MSETNKGSNNDIDGSDSPLSLHLLTGGEMVLGVDSAKAVNLPEVILEAEELLGSWLLEPIPVFEVRDTEESGVIFPKESEQGSISEQGVAHDPLRPLISPSVKDNTFITKQMIIEFAAVHESMKDMFINKFMGMGFSRVHAEDLVSDAYLHGQERLHLYSEGKGALRSWYSTVMRNYAFSLLRKRSVNDRRTEGPIISIDEVTISGSYLHDSIASKRPGPEELVIHDESQEAIAKALATLSLEQREALSKRYIDGLKNIEAAKSLGISLPTFNRRIRSALNALGVHIDVERLADNF